MRSLLFLLTSISALAVSASSQTVLFSEDFESGYSRWSMTDLWNAQDASESCTQSATPFPSGTHCVWYGSPSNCSFHTGNFDFQYLTCAESIALPATTNSIELAFRSFSRGEDDAIWDTRIPQISADDGASWLDLPFVFSSNHWLQERFDISQFAGQTIRLRFQFWIGDGTDNFHVGWLIDDIQVVENTSPAVNACSGDGTWYPCPCQAVGAAGRGCPSSFNPNGASLSATGVASLSADTLSFAADGMSLASATVFQGASFSHEQSNSAISGDGFVCFRSPYVRIRTVPAPGGALVYPNSGLPAISTAGGIQTPWTSRFYTVRYRNAAAHCGPATFNVTNTLQVTWRP